MTIRYLSTEEVEQLAKSVWRAPRSKAERCGDEKFASVRYFGIDGKSTEFPMRNGEWTQIGTFDVLIQYPMWDIPASIRVRKHQEVA